MCSQKYEEADIWRRDRSKPTGEDSSCRVIKLGRTEAELKEPQTSDCWHPWRYYDLPGLSEVGIYYSTCLGRELTPPGVPSVSLWETSLLLELTWASLFLQTTGVGWNTSQLILGISASKAVLPLSFQLHIRIFWRVFWEDRFLGQNSRDSGSVSMEKALESVFSDVADWGLVFGSPCSSSCGPFTGRSLILWSSYFLLSGSLFTLKNYWRLTELLLTRSMSTSIYHIGNKNCKKEHFYKSIENNKLIPCCISFLELTGLTALFIVSQYGRLVVWNHGVGKFGFFWELWRRSCSMSLS